MRVWVTRTRPGAEATAARLTALGHEPVVAPVLAYRTLPGAKIDLAHATALAFTSRNAVRAFAGLEARRDLAVFVTGEATARVAREAGFGDVMAADGGVDDLAALILTAGVAGEIIWPGPAEPAGDLVGALAKGGVAATYQPIYESYTTGATAPDEIDAVLIHSAKGARAVAWALSTDRAATLSLYAISAAAAAPLAALPFCDVAVAPRPDETALLGLLAG